jgi:outer membrane lipoprotein SlyB
VTKTLFLVGSAVLSLGVAGCAPARPDPTRAERVPEPSGVPGGGVIVSMRPMTVAASDVILIALNEASLARGSRPAAAVEFIIHEDGGRTVSVVQSDAAGFRPGERVVLTGGARTRVARAAG